MIRDDEYSESWSPDEPVDADGVPLVEDEDESSPERPNFRDQTDKRSAEKLWLVSYSDFMTIMMIFFLAMFGYSHMMAQREEALRRPMAYKEFETVINDMQEKLGDQIRLIDDVSKVTVELGENILFASGRADLDPMARATLTELASSIQRVDGDIIVEGHTDDLPIVSKRFRSNWELSAARAFSVVDQLVKGGVPEKRLAAWGFGENRPIAPNDSPEDRRRNRRIDIVILKKQPKASPTAQPPAPALIP